MDKKGIYLIVGIVATVLFYVLGATFYEVLYTAPGFSDEMYNRGIYGTIALITIVTTWGGAAIYYYLINSVKFARWYHWLAVMAVVVVLTPIIGYMVINHIFDSENLQYAAENASFAFSNMIYTALLFIVASFSMRWWSTNCRHTPIPQ